MGFGSDSRRDWVYEALKKAVGTPGGAAVVGFTFERLAGLGKVTCGDPLCFPPTAFAVFRASFQRFIW